MSTSYARAELPDGVSSLTALPDDEHREQWDRIVVPPGVKERLRDFALFSLVTRGRFGHTVLPTHGLAVLAGPPGTGKTTLAMGLADTVARELRERGIAPEVLLAVLDLHALPSEMLGGSQRAVTRLFEHVLPDLAGGKPLVVLMDEVEAVAVSRARASFDTNPVDVHRATNAVLTGVDSLARRSQPVVLIATTNEVSAVDAAFLSRADLIEHVGLPSSDVLEVILLDSLGAVVGADRIGPDERASVRRLADRAHSASVDARQARKLILQAVVGHGPDLALAPETLEVAQLESALDHLLQP